MSASKEMINVRPLSDNNDVRRLSALMNAAKISPLISERTLGLHLDATDSADKLSKQNGHADDDIENVHRKQNANPKTGNNNNNDTIVDQQQTKVVQSIKAKPRFRADVWREVSVDEECNRTTAAPLQLNDCKVISFRIAMSNAEKQRRAKVQSNINQKVIDIDTELESRLRQIRIESAEEAQKRLQEKRQLREQALFDAIEQMDESARQSEEASRRQMTEMIEHNRKIIDRANKMKRDEEIRSLRESIKVCKSLFISRYEAYAKALIAAQIGLEQVGKLTEFAEQKGSFLQRYENILATVNSGHTSRNELEAFEQLCEDIKQRSLRIDAEIAAFKESMKAATVAAAQAAEAQAVERRERAEAAAAAAALTARQAAADAATRQAHNNAGIGDAVDAQQQSAPISITDFVNPKRFEEYRGLLGFLDETKASVRPLQEDINYKKFRFNCKKAVNTPVNAITAVSAGHLKDKFDRIAQLLSGQRIPDFQISAADHPCGIQYCTLLLAEKFVGQADDTFSSEKNQQATYAYAAIIVAVWQLFPNFGKLFLALLYQSCPYLVPYFIPRFSEQDNDEYFRSQGYKYKDNIRESQTQYLKRLTSMQRLYSAILITHPRGAQQNQPHPHGIENGWIWLSNFLNLDIIPDICATLLLEFVQVAGSEMWRVYQRQFQKLIEAIHQHYVPRLDKVDAGGPKSRLEGLINDILNSRQIAPPSDALPLNFW